MSERLDNILPPAVRDERGFALYRAFADRLNRLPPESAFVDFDTVPAEALPHFVRSYSLEDVVTPDMPVEMIRGVLKAWPRLHAIKGTKAGVLEALGLIGMRGLLTEWFDMEPQGTPNTYELRVFAEDPLNDSGTVGDPAQRTAARRMVRSMKRHSQAGDDRFVTLSRPCMFVGMRANVGRLVRIGPRLAEDQRRTVPVWVKPIPYVGRFVRVSAGGIAA